MNKKIIFLMCLLMAMVWTAGCSCPGVRPVAAAPPVVEPAPPPPAPQPEVIKPKPVEEPAPSKKLKKRVIKETND
jgi:hypothetical protein